MKKLTLLLIMTLLSFTSLFSQAGIIDKSFANNGFITVPVGIVGNAIEIEFQKDGKLLLGGTLAPAKNDNQAFIKRYGINGENLEYNAFRIDGKVSNGTCMKLLPNGKVLIAGFTNNGTDGFLVRLNKNLKFDNSFGVSGIVRLNFSDDLSDIERIKSIAVYNNGYYLAGDVKIASVTHGAVNQFIIKILESGFVDNTFNSGKPLYIWDGYSSSNYNVSLLVQGNRLIVAGRSEVIDNIYTELAYIQPNGKIDFIKSSFISPKTKYFYISHFNLISNNKIVGMGYINNFNTNNDVLVVKLNSNGELDQNFGNGGTKTYDMYNAKKSDQAISMTELPNGKFVLAGWKWENYPTWASSFVFGINENGSINKSFGKSSNYGITNWNVGNKKLDKALACAYNPVNNMIYVAGKTFSENYENLYITRLSSGTSGLKDFENNENIMEIYPNPTSDNFTVKLKDNINGETMVKIYSNTGDKLFERKIFYNKSMTISNLNIPNGLYYIKVILNNKVYTEKIVISK